MLTTKKSDMLKVVEDLNFQEKVNRSLHLIEEAYEEFGEQLVVANSLGKDSLAVWDLAKKINKNIKGFIIVTRFFPEETIQFMDKEIERFPELTVFRNDESIPDKLQETDPDYCCQLLKIKPTRRALKELNAACWVTGLRCTEGRTRTDFQEIEERDRGLIKLNPILSWKEREVWQYLALNNVRVNPLYARGYRSLGCAPCTEITTAENERAGRWQGTSKCGGECGIHTQKLKINNTTDTGNNKKALTSQN